MKIGEPVDSVPDRLMSNSSYRVLYDAIIAAAPRIVPVVCQDGKELTRVYNALRQNGRFTAWIRRDALTIFAALKKV